MAKDFEQIGHKNIELLRFYLGKDISKIDKKIQDGESNLLGYFIASLVDILIVLFFDQGLQELLTSKIDSDLLIVGIKILCIVGLLFVFLLVVWAVKFIRNFINICHHLFPRSIMNCRNYSYMPHILVTNSFG